jgi:hypothetical protein
VFWGFVSDRIVKLLTVSRLDVSRPSIMVVEIVRRVSKGICGQGFVKSKGRKSKGSRRDRRSNYQSNGGRKSKGKTE